MKKYIIGIGLIALYPLLLQGASQPPHETPSFELITQNGKKVSYDENFKVLQIGTDENPSYYKLSYQMGVTPPIFTEITTEIDLDTTVQDILEAIHPLIGNEIPYNTNPTIRIGARLFDAHHNNIMNIHNALGLNKEGSHLIIFLPRSSFPQEPPAPGQPAYAPNMSTSSSSSSSTIPPIVPAKIGAEAKQNSATSSSTSSSSSSTTYLP